jgi:uncharacterized protein involved in response to NO
MLYHRKCEKGFGRDYFAFSRLAVIGSTAIALTAGFGFGATLALYAGFGWSVGDWWTPTLQAHGHVQVIGWLGLFIMGVSLFFVPRLSGVPLILPKLAGWAVGLLLTGAILRGIGQPALVFANVPSVRLGLPVSAILEAAGICVYLFLILSSVLRASTDRAALMSIRPYLVVSVVGWATFAYLNVDLSLEAWASGTPTFDIRWSRHAIDLYLGATLIPVSLAFSVRTFPLYLRLPPASWGVQRLGIGYVFAFGVSWLADTSLIGLAGENLRHVSGLSHLAKGLLLLLFVWKLDVLFRRRPPWTEGQIAKPSAGANPTRPGLPDHGEFGRFERLLYLGYAWLIVGAFLDVSLGFYRSAGWPDPIDADALRHVYLAGFISSLLIGMGPRMIPGFVHQRKIAYPRAVNATFWLWAVGSGFRILPLLLSPILPVSETVSSVFSIIFALSGSIGWVAIAVMTVNLWETFRRASDADQAS